MDIFKESVLLGFLDFLKFVFGKFGSTRDLTLLMLLFFLSNPELNGYALSAATAMTFAVLVSLHIRPHANKAG